MINKMINKILLITCFFSLNSFAEQTPCQINFFSKIYRFENDQSLNPEELILKTDCPLQVVNKISALISNSAGTVGVDFIKREFKKEIEENNIAISPRKISFFCINEVFKNQLTNETHFSFFNTKSLNGLKSLSLKEDELLKVNCETCTGLGEKNIKIDIANPLLNSSRSLWFSSKLMAKVKVYKTKRNLNFQTNHLTSADFYQDDIYTQSADNFLTSLDNISFYKVNKSILQDSVVSNFDLLAVNLITYGTPVKVELKNQNIHLQRIALPMRSALFGETIELKNPNNNKIILGKVIDYNKVVIEL